MGRGRKYYKPKNCTYNVKEIIEELQRENRVRRKVYKRMILEEKLTKEEANARFKKLRDAQRALILLNKIQMGELQGSLGLEDESGNIKDQNKFEPDIE